MSDHYGGCLCGRVRYRISGELANATCCHCRSCQRASGAPYVPWVSVPARHLEITKGALTTCHSSAHVTRGFCGECGSPITYANANEPDSIDVTVVTLDDPGAAPPTSHIWVSHKLPWISLSDGLPQHAEWRV